MSKNFYIALFTMAIVSLPSSRAAATLTEFWQDAPGWQAAVQDYALITFTEFPAGTIITNQYLGITVTNLAFIQEAEGYSDGFGLLGTNGIRIEFGTALYALAVDHRGVVKFDLFHKGVYLATTVGFNYAIPGGPFFSGVISDVPFDEVYMFKPQPPFSDNLISLDSLYWGMPVPGPGPLAMLALAALVPGRRRRRP